MPGPAFDPHGAVRFNLKSGAADARGGRVVLLPAAALEALERSTPGALTHLGAELGKACGARVVAQLGGESGVRGAQLEIVTTHLAGELAIAGFGALHLERWGRAMVLVVENPAVASEAFIGAVIAGALKTSTGREVAIGPLGSGRYFVGTPSTVAKARSLIAQGTAWAEVLASLQKGTA